MIYILLDRLNPNSFFKPYYDLLPPPPPHGLTNMPVFWEEEDLKRLEGKFLTLFLLNISINYFAFFYRFLFIKYD